MAVAATLRWTILALTVLAVLASPLEEPDRHHPALPVDAPGARLARQSGEDTIAYWNERGRAAVADRIRRPENRNRARNVILFVGDGMSVTTVAAARMLAGGEHARLAFEDFPYLGMSKTYCVNYQVPDSACTATAYLTGVKGNYETIGVNGKVPSYDCAAELDRSTHTESIAAWALAAGKDAGLVTTTRVTHASPAGVYAHTANRDRENDDLVEQDGCDATVVDDIAEQLVYGDVGSRLKVVLGGGRREFLAKQPDPETGGNGKRKDDQDLIGAWQRNGPVNELRQFVWNREQLMAVDPERVDRLLGLFEPSHLRFNLDVAADPALQRTEPTLAEMVDRATDVLGRNSSGFFLFVEGGRIDSAHHDNMARYALDETIEFARAVQLAREKFPEDDTLIVVTADHSHTMTFAGYPTRGSDIFGITGNGGSDGLAYMTLSYANGMGYYRHVDAEAGARIDPRRLDSTGANFPYPATVPIASETHGGDDVYVYASGPWAHLFDGVYEQNAIPHLMAYAACIGHGATSCAS